MEREVEERFERIERNLGEVAANLAEVAANLSEVAAGQQAHALAMATLDDHLTKLAAAQIVTEQKLQGLIEALRRGGNGSQRN